MFCASVSTFSIYFSCGCDSQSDAHPHGVLWTYERDGYINLNVKADPESRDFCRQAFESVIPGWHQNKEHWNTIILDGSVPEDAVKQMIADSYDIVTYSPTKRIYDAVKKIPKGCVATYGQVAEMAGDR